MKTVIFTLILSLSLGVFCETTTSEGTGTGTGYIIGIDLGTTYSCVAVYKNGRVEIITNEQGNRITPSIVAFTDDERLIGEAAKNQGTMNPENTLFDVKRIIGRTWDEIQRDRALLPYKLVNKNNQPHIQVNVSGVPTTFSPEEISAMILTRMKQIAESYIGSKVTEAIITVPAYFNDAQRQATKDAGHIAGLNVRRIINEPTAAAIAYGLSEEDDSKEKQILVFDLGGGTFDVSLLTIDNGVFEVLATSGDTHLGGEDFDQRTMSYLLKQFKKKTGLDAGKDKKAVQKLRYEAERAKRSLSTSTSVQIDIESFFQGNHLRETLTRAKFEDINMDLFRKTIDPVATVLKDAKLSKSDIHEVVLVGGSTRIPKIRQLIKDYFNGKELNLAVNPDEAVAYGAAVQGGILMGTTLPMTIIDSTPLSLGIETVGGVMTNIIDKNTFIPTEKKQVFSTYTDNQDKVMIHIYEGERALTKDNHELGKFELGNIPLMPRGKPQIEVTFTIDVNSILHVSAKELTTGTKAQIEINNMNNRRTEKELSEMREQAKMMEEEDNKIREMIGARNKLESYAYQVRSSLNSEKFEGKIEEDEKGRVLSQVSEVMEWLESDGLKAEKEEYDAKYEDLDKFVRSVFGKMYGANSGKSTDAQEEGWGFGTGHDDL